MYLSGGDQVNLRARIDAKQLDSLRNLVRGGAILIGSSAGTAVMPEEMITDGDSATLKHARGFGLVPWAVLDTHVGERHRETRDVTAFFDIGKGRRPVIGLDENTAIIFSWDHVRLIGKVAGAGTVHIFMQPGSSLPDTSRAVTPKSVETDDGTHRKADMWDLRKGDTFTVPNVRRAK